jgi:hypothetical protein
VRSFIIRDDAVEVEDDRSNHTPRPATRGTLPNGRMSDKQLDLVRFVPLGYPPRYHDA